jgi:mono/diheme cytochrome c family protein
MNVNRYSYLSFLLLFALLVAPSLVRAQDAPSEQVLAGEKLFKANCASCHKLNAKLVGPALDGVEARWTAEAEHDGVAGREWLKRWIKNWQDPVNAGNAYAVAMKEYDPSAMTQFPALQDADLENILAYIANGPIGPTGSTGATGSTGEVKVAENPYTAYMLYGLIGLLVIVALVLMRVSTLLNRLVLEKEGQPIPAAVPFWKNKKLRAALTLLVLIYIGNATVIGAIDLGRQQGYMPEQPIKFSHELHAGINKIDCQYCHNSAAESKHSNIPSTNVCMNCHKGIKGDDPKNGIYGKNEIAKIYAAAGFNPVAGNYFADAGIQDKAYIDSILTVWLSDSKVTASKDDVKAVLDQVNKPVEWTRIHNLPDHVYFNHSQHVTAGGIACQTCHGPVETMPELYQFSPLSMGWCINCHRETEVKFTQNPYYETFQVYHERLKDGEMKNVTVEKIGGTECQKCHY